MEMTPIEKSHRDPIYKTIFLQSKTGEYGQWILGSLSNNDGDGYENVTQKSKIALLQTLSRLFHHCFFGVEIKECIKGQEIETKRTSSVVLCSRPPQNVKLDIFTS